MQQSGYGLAALLAIPLMVTIGPRATANSRVPQSAYSEYFESSVLPASPASTPQQVSPLLLSQQGDGFGSEGRPNNRVSGGSRDETLDFFRLIAMVPGRMVRTAPSTTIQETPTLTFALEQSLAPITSAYLVLCDDSDTPISTETVTLPDTSGIFQLNIPALPESETWYYWRLETAQPETCSTASTEFGVQGQIQRVVANEPVQEALDSASETEQLPIYLDEELWLDGLALATQLHQAQPEDQEIEVTWKEVLRALSLQVVESKSVLDCCIQHHN